MRVFLGLAGAVVLVGSFAGLGACAAEPSTTGVEGRGTGGSGSGAVGGAAGVAGVAGSGGAAGSSGAAGSAGSDGGKCAPATGGLDPSTLPECPTCIGKAAHCLAKTVVESTAPGQVAQLEPCNDTDVCVPDVLISTLGKYDPPDCTSIDGAAGRCLSTCIGAVAKLGSFLPKASCAEGEVCAPCADPRTGQDTGACTLQCDTGPTEPKVVFSRCCGDMGGICVPPDLVDETQKKALAKDSCAEGKLCAPEKLADATFKPATCTSIADAEGRCLSTCVGLVAEQAELLPKSTCAEGELCAPCTDPRNSELTGACAINGDMPTKPPVIFDSECCAGTGLCVPTTAVPERYRTLLPPDNCATAEAAGWICAPKTKLQDIKAPFPQCQVLILGLPVPTTDPNHVGACVPKCIADAQIAANPFTALGLAQSDCMAGFICAPCVNPLDGKRTGACD